LKQPSALCEGPLASFDGVEGGDGKTATP
jgi:hypothetical protein